MNYPVSQGNEEKRSHDQWIVCVALALTIPAPWYLIAVGGLAPIPLLIMWAVKNQVGLLSAALMASAGVGLLACWYIAAWLSRSLSTRSAISRARIRLAIGAAIIIMSLLPLYGGGENIMGNHGKFDNLFAAYSNFLRDGDSSR